MQSILLADCNPAFFETHASLKGRVYLLRLSNFFRVLHDRVSQITSPPEGTVITSSGNFCSDWRWEPALGRTCTAYFERWGQYGAVGESQWHIKNSIIQTQSKLGDASMDPQNDLDRALVKPPTACKLYIRSALQLLMRTPRTPWPATLYRLSQQVKLIKNRWLQILHGIKMVNRPPFQKSVWY